MSSGPAVDAARRLVVERNLVRAAFEHLTVDAFLTLPFEALGPTKAALKRFFSLEPWGPEDEAALAAAVGPGDGWWRRELDDDLTLEYGWGPSGFTVAVAGGEPLPPAAVPPDEGRAGLAATFDGPVVPEATPNPRTVRFQVEGVHDGPSRWYPSAAAGDDDPHVARLFAEFGEVANVLVGPDFVAVSLQRPGDWERLLQPVLAVVAEEFAGVTEGAVAVELPATGSPSPPRSSSTPHRSTQLDQAWQELGSLRPGSSPQDLARVEAAATGEDRFHRQVAANLLREADPDVAAARWEWLVRDPARSVRRATVDAMVDVGREQLRPLLEAALADADAWVRWKALRGLVELGVDGSRAAVAACAEDPDFRVRLEVASALRS